MPDSEIRQYDYPVYGTQGGGLVRSVGHQYIFVEKPDCPGLDVGDMMPEEWGVIPANNMASREVDDNRDFYDGLGEFFDLVESKYARGEVTTEQYGGLFPQSVHQRNQ